MPRLPALMIGILTPILFAAAAPSFASAAEKVIDVATDAALRQALNAPPPGTRIVLAPGKYRHGVSAAALRGTAGAPIVIEAKDPKNKPVIEGGQLGIHLRGPQHVVLRNLIVRGQSGNGINIDDGGQPDSGHHITVECVEIYDVGPRGNCDALKLSGLDDLVVRDSRFEGWGGEGIDMVGCHRAAIENCAFTGKAGFSQAIGVQAKGGSADILVRNCTFLNAGQRGVNLGGSTGANFYRPKNATYEAKQVTVEGCRFTGNMAPVAFVGVDGAVVRYNTMYLPDRWCLRILQEATADHMVPSRNGRFERNIVVYQRAKVREPANVSPKTAPETFKFAENLWYCQDQPAQSRPQLPTAEQGGVYGTDPKVTVEKDGLPSAPAAEAAKGYGAGALPERERPRPPASR